MATLTHLGFVEALRQEVGQMSALLGSADLAAPVLSCPGWQVRDLAGHLGSVHRWATGVVRTGERAETPEPPHDDELLAWFDHGAVTLADTLAGADSSRACWTFAAPHDVGFWSRRQVQETMIHRWDLATAIGQAAELDPGLATDGIDEVVRMLFPRQVRLARQAPLTDSIAVLDRGSGRRWVLAGDGTTSNHDTKTNRGTAEVDATVTGDGVRLLLLLWRRVDLADSGVQVDGDLGAARRVFGARLAP